MTHNMKLHEQPFGLIRSGAKTIELRLNDEKRQKIQIGDIIVFTHFSNTTEQIHATVTNLYAFPSFAELYRSLPLDQCEYLPEELENASPDDMSVYYSSDEQKLYGVLGIEFSMHNKDM